MIRFRFSQDKLAQARQAQNSDLEFFLAPLSSVRSPLSSLGLSKTRWTSEEAAQQYSRKLKESDEEGTAFRGFRVFFSSGGSSCFLFLNPSAKTFDLHTEMHRVFAPALEGFSGRIVLDVRHLDRTLQARAIHAFSYLCATVDWQPTSFGHRNRKTKAASEKSRARELVICSSLPESEARELAQRAQYLGEANNEVRTLAELPANELNPRSYRERIREFARAHKLGFEFWDRRELVRRKAGAFLAVTRADPETAAGIAYVRYLPSGTRGKKNRKKLVLVGKGICFDTGGYCLKPSTSMLGMHGDMTGSALALALCGYFARMGADFEVHAYLALAENLISPTAFKPNEVVIASDGTSIEVVDTDAEGRMILADTLLFARKTKPDLMIDFATLTGAVMRALDTRKAGVFSHREDLAQLAVRCGDASGERAWTFPLDEDYRKALKSKIADILQCAESNNADHIYAATFLSHFAGKETPWVHLDLAPSENKGGLGLIGTSTTGFGVLWADEFVREALG